MQFAGLLLDFFDNAEQEHIEMAAELPANNVQACLGQHDQLRSPRLGRRVRQHIDVITCNYMFGTRDGQNGNIRGWRAFLMYVWELAAAGIHAGGEGSFSCCHGCGHFHLSEEVK